MPENVKKDTMETMKKEAGLRENRKTGREIGRQTYDRDREEREEDNTHGNKYSMRRTEILELVWNDNGEKVNTQR
jgi:hypothetical protein